MSRHLTQEEKDKIENMSPEEAFELWVKTDPNSSDTPSALMGRLFDRFGGEKSVLYQQWVKTQIEE